MSGHRGGSTSPSLHSLEQPPVDPGTVWKQPKVRGDEESGSIQVRCDEEPGSVRVKNEQTGVLLILPGTGSPEEPN